MAGNVDPKVVSIDNGSTSVKAVSNESIFGSESFLSIAAMTNVSSLDGFEPFRMKHDHSYRLEILGLNEEGRFDYGNRKAWVLGEAANYELNPIRAQRDMQRFNSETYLPFICGGLRTAFPNRFRTLEELKNNNWIVKNSWATPIHLYASIAPGYYSFSSKIINMLNGRYLAFVDSANKTLYVFRIEEVEVVPESFGSFQYALYNFPAVKGVLQRKKEAEYVERVRATIFDVGGQTSDWMTFYRREIVPNGYGTQLVGFNSYVEAIASDIFNDPVNTPHFARHLTQKNIIDAMRGNKGKKMLVTGIGGVRIEINSYVDAQMNKFAATIESIWRDRLESGQDIEILYLTGGSAIDAFPYIQNRLKHERRFFVSKKKDRTEMYMANATGVMAWAMNRDKYQKADLK